MLIFQKVPSRCRCWYCSKGGFRCLCGDCAGCLDVTSERVFLRNAKRISVICCCFIVAVSFVLFAPVMTVQATPMAGLGSISFCYLGQGALLVNGTYYPMTNTTKPIIQIETTTASCPALQTRQNSG